MLNCLYIIILPQRMYKMDKENATKDAGQNRRDYRKC